MKIKKGFSEIYLQFLELAAAIKNVPSTDDLDAIDLQILGELVLYWRKGEPLKVKDAIALDTIASPATLHKRIRKLRDLGYLDAQKSEKNFRSKVLVPTDLAINHYNKLGEILVNVALKNS
jgi:DNA-binding MarR family transcriptional regulator